MPLLIEKLLDDRRIYPDSWMPFLHELGDAHAIDATTVYRYCHEVGKSAFSMADVPNLAPPWPLFWVEGRLAHDYHIGTLFRAIEGNDLRMLMLSDEVGHELTSAWRVDGGCGQPHNHLEAKWSIQATTIGWRPSQRRYQRLMWSWFQVCADGQLPRSSLHGDNDVPCFGHMVMAVSPEQACTAWSSSSIAFDFVPQPETSERNRIAAVGGFLMAALAVSFMHCRNVELAPRTGLRIARKQARRTGHPVVEYRILEIEAVKRLLEDDGKISENGLKVALHICRGHFKTYTPAKPLFGKVVGQWFWPMHIRGDADAGVIAKAYKTSSRETIPT